MPLQKARERLQAGEAIKRRAWGNDRALGLTARDFRNRDGIMTRFGPPNLPDLHPPGKVIVEIRPDEKNWTRASLKTWNASDDDLVADVWVAKGNTLNSRWQDDAPPGRIERLLDKVFG